MANEAGQVFVDSKTVTAAGTPEALTTREITCTSVFLLTKVANTGNVLLVDFTTNTKQFLIPPAGITLPIGNPALINIDVSVNAEGLDWIAV